MMAAQPVGCAAISCNAERHQSLRLQAGGEATLRVDCPPGQPGDSEGAHFAAHPSASLRMSPVRTARRRVGVALAVEEFRDAFFVGDAADGFTEEGGDWQDADGFGLLRGL